jgi:hypothetical protein
MLINNSFRLYYNPKEGPHRSKTITFDPSGRLGEGNNNNEHTWRVKDGKLELLDAGGNVYSRFYYLAASRIFVHTGQRDTKSTRGQYIIPETKSDLEKLR